MDDWTDGRLDGWTDGRLDGRTDDWTDDWTDGRTDADSDDFLGRSGQVVVDTYFIWCGSGRFGSVLIGFGRLFGTQRLGRGGYLISVDAGLHGFDRF